MSAAEDGQETRVMAVTPLSAEPEQEATPANWMSCDEAKCSDACYVLGCWLTRGRP